MEKTVTEKTRMRRPRKTFSADAGDDDTDDTGLYKSRFRTVRVSLAGQGPHALYYNVRARTQSSTGRVLYTTAAAAAVVVIVVVSSSK